MRRVTRHITRETLAPALSALVIATFLLLTTQILRVGEAAFGYGVGVVDFLAILALLLPRFFVFALPLSVLVGVMACMGRLSGDRELLAWSSAGLSPSRLWTAPVIVGSIASALTLGLTTYGEPMALDGLNARLADVVERNLASGLEPGVIHQDIPGVVLHARNSSEDGELEDVFLHVELDAGRATLAARRARLQATGGRGLSLSLRDGEMVRATPPTLPSIDPGQADQSTEVESDEDGAQGPRLDRLHFGSASVGLDVADTVNRRARFIGRFDALTITELKEVATRSPATWETQRASVAFHRRVAMPFACLSLSILGFAMTLAFSRPGVTGRGAGFVGGIGAMVGYYILIRVAENMAIAGKAPAALLLWTPNAIALALACVLLLVAERR